MTYDEIIQFHGHSCPGLAIGYRMSGAAMDELRSMKAGDEELYAIVENDACGVDALQCVTGCTFGKGNLLFRDYGKQVYTVYSRVSRKGVRVVYHGSGIPEDVRGERDAMIGWILGADLPAVISVERVDIPTPEPARIRKSIVCTHCGETVMETRAQERGGTLYCIPCYEDIVSRSGESC